MILLFVITLVLYIYVRRKINLGTLIIFEDEIEIRNQDKTTYKIEDLEDLEIQRGSTYHYTYQIGNEIVKVGNYLRFKTDGISKEFEFIIDSKEKNEAFESMVNTLQRNRVKLHYTSI